MGMMMNRIRRLLGLERKPEPEPPPDFYVLRRRPRRERRVDRERTAGRVRDA